MLSEEKKKKKYGTRKKKRIKRKKLWNKKHHAFKKWPKEKEGKDYLSNICRYGIA